MFSMVDQRGGPRCSVWWIIGETPGVQCGEAAEQAEGYQLQRSKGPMLQNLWLTVLGHGRPGTQQHGMIKIISCAEETRGEVGGLEPGGHSCIRTDLENYRIQPPVSIPLVPGYKSAYQGVGSNE